MAHRPGDGGGPELLLADEPTGALDTAAGYQIMEIFPSLADQGMTILMITHEPSIAACADKTYHILDGQLLDQAPEIRRRRPIPRRKSPICRRDWTTCCGIRQRRTVTHEKRRKFGFPL